MSREKVCKWAGCTLVAAIAVCALIAAFAFTPQATFARAANEITLEAALSEYTGFDQSNDLLAIPSALRMETTGDNQTGDATFDGKELKLPNSRAQFASAKLTNDYIEKGMVRTSDTDVMLTQVPLLYRATVIIDKIGADAWKGAGLFLGVTAEGYGVGLRLMGSGGLAFWLSNAGSRRDETEVANTNVKAEQNKSYRFALIKDGDMCKVFIDEKQVAAFDLASVRTDGYKMSVQIDKIGFGAHQRGAGITVSDFSLIPLIDCRLPANVCTDGDNFAAENSATILPDTEKEIPIGNDDGKLYSLKAGSSWEYEAVNENVAGTRIAFKVSAPDASAFGIKFKEGNAGSLAYEFANGKVSRVHTTGGTRKVLQSTDCTLSDGDITVFTDLYSARIDTDTVSMRTQIVGVTEMHSTIAFYATGGAANVGNLRCMYGEGYLAQRPTDNEYVDQGPAKDQIGAAVSLRNKGRAMPWYAVTLITVGAVLAAAGIAALVIVLVCKNKNKNREKTEESV